MSLIVDYAWIGVLWAASAGVYLSLYFEGEEDDCF